MKAYIIDRKVLTAFRRVFGRRLARLRELPQEEHPQACTAVKVARKNLMAFRRAHPELIDPPARQLSLELEV